MFTKTINNSGFGDGTTSFGPAFWFVLGLGMLLAAVHDHGLRRIGAYRRGDQQRLSDGRDRDVDLRSRLRDLRLDSPLAVTFAIPSTQGALDTVNALGLLVPWIWAESMGQSWAEALLFICVVAQFFCVTASVTSASRMMFAFSRDRRRARAIALAARRAGTACRTGRCSASALRGHPDDPRRVELLRRLRGRTAIAVIGLYIAFVIPVYLRWRKGDSWEEARAWSLGKHYKWIDPLSIAWVALITILFMIPLYKIGLPWEDGFTGG